MKEILRELWAVLRELKVMLRHLGINQWMEEVIPAPRLKGQGMEIMQLELWRRSDLERAKTESWSEGV